MDQSTMVIGLDVHKDTIIAAILPPEAERPTDIVTLENDPVAVRRLAKQLAHTGPRVFVYEAGPCGYMMIRTPQ